MGDKVKVLRIIGECKTGGTETIALNYYKNLDHKVIAMDFLFYGESLPRFNRELEANEDKVINVVDYTKDLFGSIREIRDVVKENNYDIVHAQLNALNFFPLIGAFLGGAKIRIAANHSTANLKYEFKKSVMKYLVRPTAGIMATNYAACSKHAGEWCFGKRAYENGRIKIIHNAIDLTKFNYSDDTRTKVRNNMDWNSKFVIGHAGRFTEQKNHKFMVEIFAEIHKRCTDVILVFAGEGHLMESIKNQVREADLIDSVQFLGVRFDMNELMQGMDVFLFPSLYEGLGNVITEAQAVGLACIASDVIPTEVKITELVEFISLNKKSTEWADAVLKYKNGYHRSNRHEALVRSGYEIKTAVKDLEKYYMELIGR
ncbi:MAG: glycosyltransferase family 1 protein [Clostridiaceae bacterium]|nr:glycosyltransferase family 1 protein [Clostridiaceae bacterium]